MEAAPGVCAACRRSGEWSSGSASVQLLDPTRDGVDATLRDDNEELAPPTTIVATQRSVHRGEGLDLELAATQQGHIVDAPLQADAGMRLQS